MRDYKKIVAWQRSHNLTLRVYEITKSFPNEEKFGITSQLRRAAYSVPANIAEGSGRSGVKDYLRFLTIAYGSLKEAEYFLLLAHDLEYLSADAHSELTDMSNATFAALHGLIKAVEHERN
ncbi:MAG: four helix bundle protein [Planctomycetota bacterium]